MLDVAQPQQPKDYVELVGKLMGVGPQGLDAVSYTHLDVYKRQTDAYTLAQQREVPVEQTEESSGKKPKARNFLLPVILVTGITIATGEILYGTLASLVFCALLYQMCIRDRGGGEDIHYRFGEKDGEVAGNPFVDGTKNIGSTGAECDGDNQVEAHINFFVAVNLEPQPLQNPLNCLLYTSGGQGAPKGRGERKGML